MGDLDCKLPVVGTSSLVEDPMTAARLHMVSVPEVYGEVAAVVELGAIADMKRDKEDLVVVFESWKSILGLPC